MGYYIKSLAKGNVNNIYYSPLVHRVSHIIIAEGNQLGQAQFALRKTMLVPPPSSLCMWKCLLVGFAV